MEFFKEDHDSVTRCRNQLGYSLPDLELVPWNTTTYQWSLRFLSFYSTFETQRGVPSLVELCTRRAATLCHQMEKEHLQNVPSPLVGEIFEYLKLSTREINFDMWKILAPKIIEKEDAARYVCLLVMRYHFIVKKQQPLAAYIKHSTSDTFDFLTQLTIAGEVRCGTPELLQLVQLKNLAIFEIIQPSDEGGLATFPLLTDSIVREWSKAPDPFPVLRILRVWGMDFTTTHSLQYLDAFPSLVLYDVAGRKRDWAEVDDNSVWRYKKRWSWCTQFNDTLFQHFDMLQEHVQAGRWRLKPGNEMRYVHDLIDAFSDYKTRVTPFQRAAQDVDEEIPKCDEYLLPKVPPGAPAGPFYLGAGAWQTPYPDQSISLLGRFLDCNDVWGFLMYCHIGRILADRDLVAQGLKITTHGFALGKIVLPPRPMLSLTLGNSPHHHITEKAKEDCHQTCRMDYKKRAGRYETQLTFIREAYDQDRRSAPGTEMEDGGGPKRPKAASPTTTHRPLKKRRDVSSILKSFGEG
ncbi:hypothetical protein HD806DRAFT_251640 [Xylariaceae sp. AK1471]|nr:hypothetical protein HD806DRAFT_251640 [Xylariaceae sp. AK1471]